METEAKGAAEMRAIQMRIRAPQIQGVVGEEVDNPNMVVDLQEDRVW